MHPASRAFIHLSDMHFKRASDNPFDLDSELRHEVIRDAARLANQMGRIDGILISGDVAFSGHPEEYEVAQRWLALLCRAVGCHLENIYTVPGNHDVDRETVNGDLAIRSQHDLLRQCPLSQINARMGEWLTDATQGPQAFEPIRHYNAWATPYQCAVGPHQPRWTRELLLNDRSALCIVGVNSALISCRDHKEDAPLVLGESQAMLLADPSVVHLVICHHPPSWLRDREIVEVRLNRHAHIQLFGHEHSQNIELVGNTLRLFSGALHPDRSEPDWLPMYNLLELTVDQNDGHRSLRVDVYARAWDETTRSFQAACVDSGPQERQTFYLSLEPWVGLPTDAPAVREEAGPSLAALAISPHAGPAGKGLGAIESHDPDSLAGSTASGDTPPPPKATMDPLRRLAFRFLTLPHRRRFQVVQALHLDEEGDAILRDTEFYERVFQRASERNQLAALWQAVEQAQIDPAPDTANPFLSRKATD